MVAEKRNLQQMSLLPTVSAATELYYVAMIHSKFNDKSFDLVPTNTSSLLGKRLTSLGRERVNKHE